MKSILALHTIGNTIVDIEHIFYTEYSTYLYRAYILSIFLLCITHTMQSMVPFSCTHHILEQESKTLNLDIPIDVFYPIIVYALKNDASNLGTLRLICTQWYKITQSDYFNDKCQQKNISIKPVLIYYTVNSLSEAFLLLKNGIFSHKGLIKLGKVQCKNKIPQAYEPLPGYHDNVSFTYYYPEDVQSDSNDPRIFLIRNNWPAVAMQVNPNNTYVYNKGFESYDLHGRNIQNGNPHRIYCYEQSCLSLTLYMQRKQEGKKLHLKQGEIVLFNPLTCIPFITTTNDEKTNNLTWYFNAEICFKHYVHPSKLFNNTPHKSIISS